MTGFWKIDRIITLGLLYYIGPAEGYTCTLHIHSAIIRLGGLVCFSRTSFADPVNSWLRQWDPGGATWKAWVWNSPQCWVDVSYAIQACLGLWLALQGPIAKPNSPNGGFNPPLAYHSPPPPTPLPSAYPPPITRHQWYYSGFEKNCWKSSSVS